MAMDMALLMEMGKSGMTSYKEKAIILEDPMRSLSGTPKILFSQAFASFKARCGK